MSWDPASSAAVLLAHISPDIPAAPASSRQPLLFPERSHCFPHRWESKTAASARTPVPQRITLQHHSHFTKQAELVSAHTCSPLERRSTNNQPLCYRPIIWKRLVWLMDVLRGTCWSLTALYSKTCRLSIHTTTQLLLVHHWWFTWVSDTHPVH